MSLDIGDLIGIIGSICIVGAYAYLNMSATVNPYVYNGVNLAGALFLTVSLWFHFNLASFLLEIVWIAIALFGLAKAHRRVG